MNLVYIILRIGGIQLITVGRAFALITFAAFKPRLRTRPRVAIGCKVVERGSWTAKKGTAARGKLFALEVSLLA